MVHNHYLALYAETHGAIYSDSEPLICYRIHGENQTEVLSMISSKEEHISCHLGDFVKRIEELNQRLSFLELDCAEQWAPARVENSRGSLRDAWQLWN